MSIVDDNFDINPDNIDENYLFGAETVAAATELELPIAAEPEERPIPLIKVTVAPGNLAAYLTLSQTPPQPYQITVDDIYNALAEVKVEYGVMLEKIDLIVANHEYVTSELIAVGKEMVPGIDGELQYLFSTEPGGRPKDLGNYVDYYNLNLVENVTAGQVLVKKIPAQDGAPGMSVFGQPIPCTKAKDVRMPTGKGTKILPENPNELIASVNGFVRLDTQAFNKVVVEEVYNVAHDVDLSTGNLNIEGSVFIHGNVREGFQVKAAGNIKISGFVESVILEAGGNIEITGGVIGGKNGAMITAANDVLVKFADNATIIAGGNISVGDEVMNCNLQADKAINVGRSHSLAGSIVGGLISAGYEIKAVNIGADSGTLTRLRVGEQPGLLSRKQNMQLELKNRKDKLAELKTVIASLNQRQQEREAPRQIRSQQQTTLQATYDKLYQRMHDILAQAERDGLITSAAMIESLEAQISETRDTVQRVESSIETLRKRIDAKVSLTDSLKNRKTLEQFQVARENLISKLVDLETQLTQRTANRMGNLPWANRRELEQIQEQLKTIKTQLAAVEADNATDQRINDALSQLNNQYATVQAEVNSLQVEMDELRVEIEKTAGKVPHVIASGNLFAGAEVVIGNHRRRFTKNRVGIRVQLSENETIVALNLV